MGSGDSSSSRPAASSSSRSSNSSPSMNALSGHPNRVRVPPVGAQDGRAAADVDTRLEEGEAAGVDRLLAVSDERQVRGRQAAGELGQQLDGCEPEVLRLVCDNGVDSPSTRDRPEGRQARRAVTPARR